MSNDEKMILLYKELKKYQQEEKKVSKAVDFYKLKIDRKINFIKKKIKFYKKGDSGKKVIRIVADGNITKDNFFYLDDII